MQMNTVAHLEGLLLSTPVFSAALTIVYYLPYRRILLHIIASDPRFHRRDMMCGWENRKYRRWLGIDDKLGRVPHDCYRGTCRKFQGSRFQGRRRTCGVIDSDSKHVLPMIQYKS